MEDKTSVNFRRATMLRIAKALVLGALLGVLSACALNPCGEPPPPPPMMDK
jgi:hypothetical protein